MNATQPIHGDIWLHEFADGRLLELRRDHRWSPDLFVECRLVMPSGRPFAADDGRWSRITGADWTWCEHHMPDLMADIRRELPPTE